MDSGSESDDLRPQSLLPDIAKNQVAASLWGPPSGKTGKIFDRLMAPVRQKAEAIADFKFRAGAPPRVPRPEPQPLPVVPAPEETERKTSYRHWVAKTARPRLALRRLQVTQAAEKAEEKAPKPRPRAASTAAEAAFIQEVLGVDRTIVRGNDISAELAGRVEELGELAKHRWDCRLNATQTSRKKAVQWRAQQIQRETLFRTRCRASIIVHQNPGGAVEGPHVLEKSPTTRIKPSSAQPLIMKGISCDTGILNVTFCPLMEEHNTDEHDEEAWAFEPSPTPLVVDKAATESESRPSLLRSMSSKRSMDSVGFDQLMDIDLDDKKGQDEHERLTPKMLVNAAAGELLSQNRKKRRELNKRLREVRRRYKDKVKEATLEDAEQPQKSSQSMYGELKEGMPSSSKAFLSQISPMDEKTYRDVLRQFTDIDAIDQSDVRPFLESVGFKPRNKPEREVMNNLLRNLDSLDIGFDVLFGEIIPAIRLGFAEIRSQHLVKRFHEADVDKSGVLSLIELLQILRWSGFFPRLHLVVQTVLEVIPDVAEVYQGASPQALLEKDIIMPTQFHILAPLLEERAECDYVQRRVEIAENMDLDEETQKLWGSSLVDLHDVFLRRAKQDLLPFTSLHHLAFDCGLVQHRAPGFREKLRSIAAGEVSPQMMEEGYDLHDPNAVERAHFDFRQVLRIMTQIRQIEVELIGDVFAATDGDETNGLSVEECMDCLAACGIEPTTKQMQDLIPRLVEEFDEDGSGELDLEEYLEFAKFVADRIRKMQHVGNMDDAQRIGYGEDEYMRLWDAFVAADENLDSHLEESELLVAVTQARPHAEMNSSDIRAILKEQGIGYWKQEVKLTMRDFLQIMKDVDMLQTWRTLGAEKGIEKEAVEGFISMWRMLTKDPKEDTVSPKELARAVKSLPGAQIKMARIRFLQQTGSETIDFMNFLQVMRKTGSDLGDGGDLTHLGADLDLLSPLQTPGTEGGGHILLSPVSGGSVFSQMSPRPGVLGMKRGDRLDEEAWQREWS